MLEQRIQQQFFDAADLAYQAAETLSRPIADAAQALMGGLTAGGKLLLAGAGVSQAVVQAMAAQLVGPFERERPGLAALVLGSDAVVAAALSAHGDGRGALAKQVQVLGAPGDVLLAVACDDDAALAEAVAAAREQELTVVALVGRGSRVAALLGETDVLVEVPHERAARLLEVHLLIAHCLCDALDLQLMGEQDPA